MILRKKTDGEKPIGGNAGFSNYVSEKNINHEEGIESISSSIPHLGTASAVQDISRVGLNLTPF